MSLTASSETSTQLTGRRLALARGVWILVVTLAVGLYISSIPLQLAFHQIVCSGSDCPFGQISPAGLAQLGQAGVSPGFYAGGFAALNTLVALVFWIVAAVIFWRRSSDWLAIFASFTLVVLGANSDGTAIALVGQHYPALLFLTRLAAFIGSLGIVLFFYLFPDGRLAPRWMLWLLPVVVAYAALRVFQPDLLGNDWYFSVELASLILAQIYRYWRVSKTVQRQQTKWVVYGSVVGVGGILGLTVLGLVLPAGGNQQGGIGDLTTVASFQLFTVLIPLSIGMAILRSHLWDIDLLIRRTLIYGLLTALLALVYLGAVVALQAIFTALTGEQRSELVTVISTLVIAALFVPLRSRLQALIDRRFYRRKYDAARTLAQFSGTLRDEVNLDELSAHLLAAVDNTMQPESVALWLVQDKR